jgi:hypothetical protein
MGAQFRNEARGKWHVALSVPGLPEALPLLGELEAIDLRGTPRLPAAARWYLRAVRGGPRPDAIVAFWVAIEALVGSEKTSPKQVVSALEEAGADLSAMTLSVGQLAGLRAEVVHKGVERPPTLERGYYYLEAICRILMREIIGSEGIWPLLPDPDAWGPPVNEEVRRAWGEPPQVNLKQAR